MSHTEPYMKKTILPFPEHFTVIATALVRAVHNKPRSVRAEKRTPVLPPEAPTVSVMHDVVKIMDQQHNQKERRRSALPARL